MRDRGAPVVEELVDNEWDWEVAIARARAAAEEIEQARPPPPVEQLTLQQPDEWRDDDWSEVIDKARRQPTANPTRPSAVTIQPIAFERSKPIGLATLKTVIPVPSLPVANDISAVRPLEAKPPLPAAPRRFPRATARKATGH